MAYFPSQQTRESDIARIKGYLNSNKKLKFKKVNFSAFEVDYHPNYSSEQSRKYTILPKGSFSTLNFELSDSDIKEV